MGIAVILLIIGICLIVLNVRGLKKEKGSFHSVFSDQKINIDEVKVEIGILRKEFAETLLEIQSEMIKLKDKLDIKEQVDIKEKLHINDPKSYKENTIYDDKIEDIKDIIDIDFNKKNLEDKNGNDLRVKEVEELMKKGLSIEKIADILKVGKGEILLIKELYLK
ncbi:hypothetical protein [Clostridium massiliodielmoense]|uniref:hypothetical protein n=1 Tax=Clostridium massiliodielmoense TaxID=1776385 RepID=UPI0004D425E8|nr:hypothetical protein [Clostridium massiliodielmoense]KEH96933.1 hypothetical protein Z962_05445 [Clostridium botulinum C/D str. BKT12695]